MTRRTAVVLLIGVVLFGGAVTTWRLTRPKPAPAPVAAVASAPARVPVAPTPEPDRRAPVAAPARPAKPAVVETPAAPAEPAPAVVGILRIDSDVPGAQVFLDRTYIGVTPMTADDVAPGRHRLNATAPGYESQAQDIDVEPGSRDVEFTFKEIRLDAAIDVIHKHRFGSCQGRLIATPQGIRYETTDKGDAFSTPLTDLEVFEVEYLAKVLRVKIRKGKRFDFTNEDANADKLFVFHRDVDKARVQLNAKR